MASATSSTEPISVRALPTSARFPGHPEVTPPRFIVDLSKPPEERYAHIAPTFADHVGDLASLYDDLLQGFLAPSLAALLVRLSPRLLRRVHDHEETRELHGIRKASGVPLYLLVAFNVVLDLLMGCTSGGVRVRNRETGEGGASKMLHFRALDWGMDPLRKLVMEVEYVRKEDGPVVARSVTYFGYVGVLTGVRKGLSMSLNFRPHHEASSRATQAAYASHLFLVLFGFRRSISSVLRGYLLREPSKELGMEALLQDLSDQKSTAAYLIFSDGAQTVSMEKDNGRASTARSSDFIVTLNHDVGDEKQPEQLKETIAAEQTTIDATGMEDLVSGSIERKRCTVKLYDSARRWRRKHGYPQLPLEEEELVGWMEGPDIINDQSHYGVIMDPQLGNLVWLQRWLEPLDYDENATERERAQRRWVKQGRATLARHAPIQS